MSENKPNSKPHSETTNVPDRTVTVPRIDSVLNSHDPAKERRDKARGNKSST